MQLFAGVLSTARAGVAQVASQMPSPPQLMDSDDPANVIEHSTSKLLAISADATAEDARRLSTTCESDVAVGSLVFCA